jgi:hypothetical protein
MASGSDASTHALARSPVERKSKAFLVSLTQRNGCEKKSPAEAGLWFLKDRG